MAGLKGIYLPYIEGLLQTNIAKELSKPNLKGTPGTFLKKGRKLLLRNDLGDLVSEIAEWDGMVLREGWRDELKTLRDTHKKRVTSGSIPNSRENVTYASMPKNSERNTSQKGTYSVSPLPRVTPITAIKEVPPTSFLPASSALPPLVTPVSSSYTHQPFPLSTSHAMGGRPRRNGFFPPTQIGNITFTTVPLTNGVVRSSLHSLAKKEHIYAMKVRIEDKGENINIQDAHGRTPLHIAVISNQVRSVEFIASRKNTNPNIRDRNNETPLSQLIKLYPNNKESNELRPEISILNALLNNKKLDLSTTFENDNNILHLAVERSAMNSKERIAIFSKCYERKRWDVFFQKNADGKTPFDKFRAQLSCQPSSKENNDDLRFVSEIERELVWYQENPSKDDEESEKGSTSSRNRKSDENLYSSSRKKMREASPCMSQISVY